MDINKEKERIVATLNELKRDIEFLSRTVENMLESIENVKTKEDAMLFDEHFINIEKHLRHIRLF